MINPSLISKMVEVVIAGSIGIKYGLAFESYQTDITISGQGFMEDTYFIDIQFRPVPKNIVPVQPA